jgi:hypothetical protein
MSKDDTDQLMEFIDFCIEKDEDLRQSMELMFMYYVKSKLINDKEEPSP